MPDSSVSVLQFSSWTLRCRGLFVTSAMASFATVMTVFVMSGAALAVATDRDLVPSDVLSDEDSGRNGSFYDRRVDDGDQNTMACELAYHKCLNRDGCKTVLGYYIEACEDLQGGWTTQCSRQCRRALIGLTSTEEGKLFMQCRCSEERCTVLKQRILACKPAVESALRDPDGLSCLDAEMVCEADAPCGKALQYYKHHCRKMFTGLKCNRNCLNSLMILRRQEKAGPLKTCRCDGTESYDCPGVRTNVERLCLPPSPPPSVGATDVDDEEDQENRLETAGDSKSHGPGGDGTYDAEDTESEGVHNKVDDDYGDYSASKKVQFPYSVNSASRASSWVMSMAPVVVVAVARWR